MEMPLLLTGETSICNAKGVGLAQHRYSGSSAFRAKVHNKGYATVLADGLPVGV